MKLGKMTQNVGYMGFWGVQGQSRSSVLSLLGTANGTSYLPSIVTTSSVVLPQTLSASGKMTGRRLQSSVPIGRHCSSSVEGKLIIIIIIIQWQCLWCWHHDYGHCESSPCSFDECRLSAGWPPTLGPSQLTWAVSPPINGCYHPHPPSPSVIITQPESLPSHGGWKAEST